MKTKQMILCALFAALTGVCSIISVPLPFTPVPISLATLSVMLSGGLLGKKYGSISQAVYVALGAVGAPIFSNMQSGVGVLAGPTGGFLLGYVAAAFLTGLIIEKASFRGCFVVACLTGLGACFLLGVLWFMHATQASLWAALGYCVFPFVAGDAVKLIAAAFLIRRLRPVHLFNDTN